MVAMWLILSIAAVLMFTAVNLLMRIMAIKSIQPRTFSFIFNCWSALFAVIILFIERPSFAKINHVPAVQILLIAAAALFYGLYERTHFLARKHIDASTTAIIFRLSPVIAFIGSLIILKESIELPKLMGAAFLLGSSLLVVHKNPQLKAHRALWIALFSASALGLAWMIDKPASVGIPASFYSVILWTLPLLIIAFPSLSIHQLAKELKIGGWKIALTAFLNVFGFVLYLKALALADASQVILIAQSSATLVVLGGIIFLKERSHLGRKLIAGALMLIGILLLR